MKVEKNKGFYLHNKLVASAFSIIVLFVALTVVGIAIIPSLRFKLKPDVELNSLNVSFYWPGASAQNVEHQAINPIEEVLSTLKGVRNIRSESKNGYGEIQVDVDEHVSIKNFRYEAAMLLRRLYHKLPDEVSYPQVNVNQKSGSNKTLLNYTINANIDPADIEEYIQQKVLPNLSRIKGVRNVQIYGATGRQWQINYNPLQMERFKIKERDLVIAVNEYFSVREAGPVKVSEPTGKKYFYINIKTARPDTLDWDKLPIKKVGSTLLYLKDVASINYTSETPRSYYRINGLNTVNLEIQADETANQLAVAGKVKDHISKIKASLPNNFSVLLSYDSTQYLKNEIDKIVARTTATFLLLLVFVWLANRQKRYLLLITISLLCNVLIACVFYAFVGLEIHIYSLAAITVSAGMMIDNSIVTIDHIRRQKNLKVVLAVAGASLTTMGAVSIVFFLKKETQANLLDFAWIMIINLGLSVLIALFSIPALMEKLPLPERKPAFWFRRKRRIAKRANVYAKAVGFSSRYRWPLWGAIVLLFGLPIFLLPPNLKGEDFWTGSYNKIFGSEVYNEQIRPIVDVALGGTLRLFLEHRKQYGYDNSGDQQTTLYVNIALPNGATPKQMDNIVADFENYLASFEQANLFVSRVYSGQNANIKINFRPEDESGPFPYALKSYLENKAVNTGLADFQIYGVGQGFNNALYTENTNYAVTLHGFNYDNLAKIADDLSGRLKQNPRVEKVYIASDRLWDGSSIQTEWLFRITQPKTALLNGVSPHTAQEGLRYFSAEQQNAGLVFYDKKYVPVAIVPNKPTSEIWQLMNQPLRTDSGYMRIQNLAHLEKQRVGENIVRNNQQYQLVVNYNFIGDYLLGNHYIENITDSLQNTLPLGYSVEEAKNSFWQNKGAQLIWTVLLTIGIVFLVCAVLLNSLSQALAVIAMVPISFIGVFLMVYFFEYPFEEGGYAALIILCGVVVNAALYILNDYNNLKRRSHKLTPLRLYLKAFNTKIIPIILSTASMILGLIPFVVLPDKDTFWYTLAMSAIGGLGFSMVAILFYLPVFFRYKEQRYEHAKGRNNFKSLVFRS
ncbi:efflux RND transporter permease subunit [Pelobium manganitolerans]|uniref:efflux RND transporter permease subunit n=1 Tax=Pelobium manganitolerans TaxID=1842495 RepID=UPI003FA36FBE